MKAGARKERFRKRLGEDLIGNHVVQNKTPDQAVTDGLREDWLCEWPECRRRGGSCGAKYGCAMVPAQ